MIATRRGWLHLASGAGVGRIFGFASNLLLSRWLGPTELGLFNLVTTTVQTSETLVRCGGDFALNFELGAQPEAMQKEHGSELARGLAQLCTLTTSLICILIAVWVGFIQGLFPSSLVGGQRLIMTGLLLLMISCEGISAAAWEILLVSHRTAQLALRQGVFFPLRLLFAAAGSLFGGVNGAMCGWILIAFVQCSWLRSVLQDLWNPFKIWPLLSSSLCRLLKRGLPFYAANLLASLIFYPLLLKVATGSGLTEIGYLRVGQILQQVFAFLPATLVPVLFLKLRSESKYADQVAAVERPVRMIWLLLLEVLLLYTTVDTLIVSSLFGVDFISALLPTRLLLITALLECLAQLIVQPLLAAGKTRLYGLCQNGAAILAAVLGWLWIPSAGLAAYLIVRMLYAAAPLVALGAPVLMQFHQPRKILSLALTSIALSVLFITQILAGLDLNWLNYVSLSAFMLIAILHRQDFVDLKRLITRMA